MTLDDIRDIRRLAKRFRIFYKYPVSSKQWPPPHRNTFSNIRKLGQSMFETFCANIDIRLTEEPWREQIKHRAEWLAARAVRLRQESRNEAGWRFGLENDVFHRFSVEVACPKCRARIWRSEIEASIDAPNEDLEKRRRNRQPCHCGPDTRQRDYYEIGTNPLFLDRVQETIIYDPLVRSMLPKQQLDRIYGLNQTTNFDKSLSQPIISNDTDNPRTVRDAIKITPFKEGVEPLLFHFLVVEAKSEKSQNGFNDIQAQTAFPIWALLKLQEELRASVVEDNLESNPLVWFLANRGDSWRVYGAYIANNGLVIDYDGCILSRDGALQLLLIVDYIFDWARDLYRPSILRQLMSLATGRAYDTISLASDSDIFSMRSYVSDWIQPAPSTVDAQDKRLDIEDAVVGFDHQSMLNIPIPNTQLGTIRSASLVECQLIGLHPTEDNVCAMLNVYEKMGKAKEAARKILNSMAADEEPLLVTQEALDDLEFQWTGIARPPRENAMFLARFRFTAYISLSWDIVKEISYMAISEPAYDILMATADFKRSRNDITGQMRVARKVGNQLLYDTIDRLRYAPSSRTLIAAISCTTFAFCPVPKKVRDDHTPPTDGLELTQIRSRDSSSLLHRPRRDHLRDTIWYAHFNISRLLNKEGGPTGPSPTRLSNRREQLKGISNDDMGRLYCSDPFASLGSLNVSDYGLEDLLQARSIYHTIRHFVISRRGIRRIPDFDWIWNLPYTHWPCDAEQLADIHEWIKELQSKPLHFRKATSQLWDRMQIVMGYLQDGKTYEEGQRASKRPWDYGGNPKFEDT